MRLPKVCPMWKHKFRELQMATTEEKEQAVNDYLATKRAIELDKQKLMKLQTTILNTWTPRMSSGSSAMSGIIERTNTEVRLRRRQAPRPSRAPGKWERARSIKPSSKKLASLPTNQKTNRSRCKTPGKKPSPFESKNIEDGEAE